MEKQIKKINKFLAEAGFELEVLETSLLIDGILEISYEDLLEVLNDRNKVYDVVEYVKQETKNYDK